MTEKNLSPQVLKFVKTKMQRTGLPRNKGKSFKIED